MPETQHKLLETQLRSLDTAMDKLCTIAALDFAPVAKLVKDHFTNHKHTSDQRKNFAAVVHQLQYYDLLHQSIGHIQELHDRFRQAISGKSNEPIKTDDQVTHSLARLNHLQFQVGCLGLNRAIEQILRLLKTAQAEFLNNKECFANHTAILDLANDIAKQFHTLAGLSEHWNASDVQPRTSELNALYSTAMERTVLEYFLKEPGVSAEHIHKTIQYNQAQSSTIDLF